MKEENLLSIKEQLDEIFKESNDPENWTKLPKKVEVSCEIDTRKEVE